MSMTPNSFRLGPDARGHFGPFGGRYVAETLMPLLLKLEADYLALLTIPNSLPSSTAPLKHYVGRPSRCISPNA
jgi:tryptophan synthase beta chain